MDKPEVINIPQGVTHFEIEGELEHKQQIYVVINGIHSWHARANEDDPPPGGQTKHFKERFEIGKMRGMLSEARNVPYPVITVAVAYVQYVGFGQICRIRGKLTVGEVTRDLTYLEQRTDPGVTNDRCFILI